MFYNISYSFTYGYYYIIHMYYQINKRIESMMDNINPMTLLKKNDSSRFHEI